MDEAGMTSGRPQPAMEEHALPFWDAARDRRLVLARCDTCGEFSFPPEISCGGCGSPERSWVEATGAATLWSWTVCHPPMLPWFAERGPWVVAVVELDEGPRMVTTLRGVATQDLEIGLALRADFEDVGDDTTLVVFGAV